MYYHHLYSLLPPVWFNVIMRFLWFFLILIATSLALFPLLNDSSKGIAQLVLVCLVTGSALCSKQTVSGIPKSLLLFALVASISSAFFHYSHLGLQRGGVLVATITESDLREDVKIYRDRLRKSIVSQGKGSIGLHSGSVTSRAEARAVLERSPSLGGIIWGNERWTTVSFQRAPPIALAEIARGDELRDFLGTHNTNSFLLVRGIPSLGLSDGHSDASVDFIGNIASLWSELFFAKKVFFYSQERPTGEDLEAALVSIARRKSSWTSQIHLAVPYWMLGTLALSQAIASDSIERGYLLCSIRYFKMALRQGKASDNPALRAAIHNNLAAALFLRSHLQGRGRKTRKMARRYMLNAMRVKEVDRATRAVIHHNITMLTLQKKGRGKRRKKQ